MQPGKYFLFTHDCGFLFFFLLPFLFAGEAFLESFCGEYGESFLDPFLEVFFEISWVSNSFLARARDVRDGSFGLSGFSN